MQAYFEQLAAHIRLADLLDVTVIAVLLYGALSWFRQRASRSMAVGVTLVAGLFLCARSLDMYLTTVLFQAGFTVALIGLIVVFQHDLRRAFERLSVMGPFRRARRSNAPDDLVDTIVESVATMADSRTGALLVFEGREPLERHARGGVVVEGRVSLPLLYSIFHPQSPGHDGAVLIDEGRIQRLGAHLPLSKNLEEVGASGTRHAAALGLAERCDALILVVSEERGTISVARHGRLEQTEPAELTARLEDFLESLDEPSKTSAWRHGLTRDFRLKSAALVMACVLWLLFAYRVETLQRTYVVPIEYRNVPGQFVVEQPQATRAELTLSGSELAFDLLDASELAVSLDLADVQSATPHYLRTVKHLKGVPAELTVNQIRPAELYVTVSKKRTNET